MWNQNLRLTAHVSCVETLKSCVCCAGFILRLPIWGDAADDNCFDDEPYWEVRLEAEEKTKLIADKMKAFFVG